MTNKRPDSFEHALHTANTWLNGVTEALGTQDQQLAYRALRGWLHTFRDRLTVDVAANFAAQLPELLRGVYYEGWDPSRVPVKMSKEEFLQRVRRDFPHEVGDTEQLVSTVLQALRQYVTEGEWEDIKSSISRDLRPLIPV
jgi:uncharacterized protein (DUF2267 family)